MQFIADRSILKKLPRLSLILLLIIYLMLASAYSLITPIFEASDELWHYPTVKYLVDNGLQLPVQNPAVSTSWRQQGSQPPLYYILSALLTAWIDTSDLSKVRQLNPHADIGVIVPDGNVNMVVHDRRIEGFPWHGTVLAVHVIRLFSVFLGAITVSATYFLTIELFPKISWLPLAAGAFTALNPMFLFISGSVNNDNLSNALGCILLLLIIRLLKSTERPPIRDFVLIGIITGAGMLAKFNIGFMTILFVLALITISYRLHDWQLFMMGSLITGGITIILSGWWYIRNLQLYGDPTGLNMFLDVVGRRMIPANIAQLWSERHTFLMSYWGFFGGVNVALPSYVYTTFNLIALLSVVGLIILFTTWIFGKNNTVHQPYLLGRLFTLVWVIILFIGLLRWTSETWASQGRLMFSAIAPISMWMAVGLWALPRFGRFTIQLSAVWFAVVAIAIAPLTIYTTYETSVQGLERTSPRCDLDECSFFTEPGKYEPSLVLAVRESASVTEARVGSYFLLEDVQFYTTNVFNRNWSAFIHLETEDGLIVAQRDVYLKQGLVATTFLNVGESWLNRFAVRIPDFAYAPQTVNVYLGFYDASNPSDRMLITDTTKPNTDRIFLQSLRIIPRDSSLNIMNPMNVNFGNEAELIGYEMSNLITHPGKQLKLTLYWRSLRRMTVDYRVFAQVLNFGTTQTFANSDAMPAAWMRPTTTWKFGEIIRDEHILTIAPNTLSGTWQLQVGMYQLTEDKLFRRLRIITPDGSETDDVILLTKIKVVLTPPIILEF